VASVLQERGFATLLLDLLTAVEEREDAVTHLLRFNIDLLAVRLEATTDWVRQRQAVAHLPVGYFGASTGAAAALVAAAALPGVVRAVVSRGGRPDLAAEALPLVQAPTLLIVGGADDGVLDLNQRALQRLQAPRQLTIVANATHLFEEPGALEAVASLAGDWFGLHLSATGAAKAYTW
jgi:putative phosphoribosyl transferase